MPNFVDSAGEEDNFNSGGEGSEDLGGAKIKKRPGKPKKEAKDAPVSVPVDDEVADPLIVDRILSHRTVKRSKR